MPRVPNYLDHEACPAEDDDYGWDDRPGQTYDVPIWMERMGLLEIPDWMRTEDGSCSVDYRIGMGHDKPKMYVTSLAKKSSDDDETEALPKQPVCRYFAKNNRCKYGEHCYFSHEALGSEKPDAPRARWISEKEVKKSHEQIAREAREKREDEAGNPIKPCRYYLASGGCKKGVRCPNRHIEEDGSPAKCGLYRFTLRFRDVMLTLSRIRLKLIVPNEVSWKLGRLEIESEFLAGLAGC